VGDAVTAGYLLDTNHVGHAVMASSVVRGRIAELRKKGVAVGTCVPVLCEIEAGVQFVRQPDAYRANLQRLLRQVRVWPLDLETARRYGAVHQDLKKCGRVLSQVDMMLAALATQMKLTVVTSDQDFKAIAELPTENWLPS